MDVLPSSIPAQLNAPVPERKLCDLKLQERAGRKSDTSTLPTTFAVLERGVTPEELLQGGDKAQWKMFREQGAMVLKLRDGWDFLDDTSALCDLGWIGTKKLKLRTLGPDYQYIRQSLPDPKTGMLQPFEAMDDVDLDLGVGAFVEDFQERCRTHADQFRLMGVDARESWFLQQVHSEFPLQFPYLQGIALEALMKNVKAVNDELSETHPWDPRRLGERPPSVLRRCLQACETANNHTLRVQSARANGAQPIDAGAPVSAEEARRQEFDRTGGKVVPREVGAAQRREERRDMAKKGTRHSSAGREIEASANEDVFKASENRLWGVGIVTPWLYYMGVGSIFPLHFEDYAFSSANVILADPEAQAWVVWYSIPREDLYLLHVYLQETLGSEYEVDILELRKLWLDPARIEEWNKSKTRIDKEQLRVYRHVQRPGDYVITDYGSVHWGVNLGHGWKAAVNYAYTDWKAAAMEVDQVYKRLEKETGMQRHYRCCPRFDEHPEIFAEESIYGEKPR
jgi:hypothetical protein